MRGGRASSRPSLLLVEDDPGVRRVLRDMLRRVGYTVREAADGSQALEALAAATLPDAIVLDVLLPGLSGLDVLDRLRTSGVAARVPVIAITGAALPDATMQEKGARGVLRKPFSLRELRQIIEAAIRPSPAV